MIIDKLTKMNNYSEIPLEVIDFVKKLNAETPCDKYIINENIYVNVEEYNTKKLSNAKFESHKKYIDIQILLNGKERVYLEAYDKLQISNPYNAEKDITFYKDDITNSDFVTLDGCNFVMIYPHEAHAPQIETEKSLFVKKAVVKIKLS